MTHTFPTRRSADLADRRPDARARHGRGAGPSAQAGGIRPDKARAERPCLDIPRGLRACLAQTRAAASPVTWMRISTGAVIIGTRLTDRKSTRLNSSH